MNLGFNFLMISNFLFILKGKRGKQKTSVSVKKLSFLGTYCGDIFLTREASVKHVKLDPCAFSFLSKEAEPLNSVFVLVEMQIHGCAQCLLIINGSLLNTSECEILWKDLQDADVLPIPLPRSAGD